MMWVALEVVAVRGVKIAPEVRREVVRLRAQGLTYPQILARVDVSQGSLTTMLRPLGGVVRKDMLVVSGRRLSLAERVEIGLGLERGWSCRRIGAQLGRAASTVCREVAAGGGREGYRPVPAHERARAAARRPKPRKLADPVLCAAVSGMLEALWSPRQIACFLREHGSVGSVSHETIYQSLFVQGRGELRRELARCLRTGRAARRARGRLAGGPIRGMVMISQRPAEAADRAVPGHWEGDLIAGKNNASHIATLVERSTRYVLLAKVSDARAETVAAALTRRVTTLPAQLRKSLTWDQGREMAAHAAFSVATGIPVYFCDPHSPWQRGSNENTNGLLRQYFPKGTPLDGYTQDDLDAVAVSLNTRPRQTLGWKTPAEALAEFLDADAA
jgi:transposase, IS30 family